jgi:hypothetical protein
MAFVFLYATTTRALGTITLIRNGRYYTIYNDFLGSSRIKNTKSLKYIKINTRQVSKFTHENKNVYDVKSG